MDDDLELFLTRGLSGGTAAMTERLARVAEQLTPGRLADYHRQLARISVATLRRELRQRLGALQRNLEGVERHLETASWEPRKLAI